MVFVLQRTLQVSSEYYAVAAVSRRSLAVGYRFGRGIDLINIEGQVLRQISKERITINRGVNFVVAITISSSNLEQ
ncbi:hypothetical protein PoB_005375700 [Plakobranchus ocellatus]|uniref:Uncharacterized protein n=1 Tax=Plakobranchus ocellatus TaxID=259542 RepID=A0AAV4C6P7_9GAST|nr:hypothetical protein PoB_005375700 [Plakobranchus ocellatus]